VTLQRLKDTLRLDGETATLPSQEVIEILRAAAEQGKDQHGSPDKNVNTPDNGTTTTPTQSGSAATPSGGSNGGSQSPGGPSGNTPNTPQPGGQSGNQPDAPQPNNPSRSNWRKHLLWSLIGLSGAGLLGGGWWALHQPGVRPTGHDLQRLYQLQLSKSDALPWLVGGIAGLVRYLMHNENDESDPIWSALKVGLLAGLGTEAIRQYSALSSIGISQPLPKMFQHLLAQIGLATEPNWLKDLDRAKYYDTREQLYAKSPKDDQASQDSQSSNGPAASTTQGPAATSGSTQAAGTTTAPRSSTN